MNTLVKRTADAFAAEVWFADSKLFIRLTDGREIGVPIDWFPKLRDATDEERSKWRLIGKGQGIHWESLDEDLSVNGLLGT